VNENKFVSIYVTHDKVKCDSAVNLLSKNNFPIRLRTSTQGEQRDTLYEILIEENNLEDAQKLIISNNF
jgi:hypothetical protein